MKEEDRKDFQRMEELPSPENSPAQLRGTDLQSLLLNLRASIEHYASFGRRTQ
jgi:hypothetical protein